MSNVFFSVYGPDGVIRRSLDVPLCDAALNLAGDESLIEGLYDPDTTVVVDGVAVAVPPRPSPSMSWLPRLRAWVDLRSEADRAADLATRRAAASADKSALLIEAMARGIIDPAELDQLSAGHLPPRFEAAAAALSTELRSVALARWRLEPRFGRTHPVIVAAALALGIDDETLDQIFGVQ